MIVEITEKPDSFTPVLVINANTFTSSLNAFRQDAVLPGSRWAASFTWTNRKGAVARKLTGQLAKLLGPVNTFKIALPVSLIGTGAGTGVVNGAGQTGSEIITDGWDASQALLLAAGDWIEIDQAVYLVTDDVASDGAGNATISISPPIRRSPPDNASVSVSPSFYMKTTKNDAAQFSFGGAQVFATSLDGLEID